MHAWITDRPLKKRRKRNEDMPRLELPLECPMAEREPVRDTKGEKESSKRGSTEVDFYI